MTGVEERQGAEFGGQSTKEGASTQTEFWRCTEASLASVLDLQPVRGNDPKLGKGSLRKQGKTISEPAQKLELVFPPARVKKTYNTWDTG